MKIIFRVLSPTRIKIILFILFLFVLWVGYGQTYAFKDGEEAGLPKPFLYDILGVFPFWPLWMYLSIPLLMIESLFSAFGIHFFPNGYPFIIKNIIYFYILASLVGYYIEKHCKLRRQKNSVMSNEKIPRNA